MEYLIVILIGYAFGCIQASYILGRILLKKDIRDLGNGNAGASNAVVVFGKRFGFATVLIDAFKAVVAIAIVRYMYRDVVSYEMLNNLVYLAGFFAIIGHNFPFYMGFKGGKGTAALIGLLFAIDYRLGLISVIVMILVIAITDYMVIGTFSLLIMLLTYTIAFHLDYINGGLALILCGMSVYKHYINIVMIRDGSEKRVLAALKAKRKKTKDGME